MTSTSMKCHYKTCFIYEVTVYIYFRHIGDLGNIAEHAEDGSVLVMMHDYMVMLSGDYSVIGRAMVVRYLFFLFFSIFAIYLIRCIHMHL